MGLKVGHRPDSGADSEAMVQTNWLPGWLTELTEWTTLKHLSNKQKKPDDKNDGEEKEQDYKKQIARGKKRNADQTREGWGE